MGNTSTEMDNDDVEYFCDEIFNFSAINGAFFILVFIFSVAGNTLLFCVLVVYENLKNATNLFVLNLACSDMVFTLTLPFWVVYHLHHWVFGDFLCKLVTAAYFVGLYSTVILLTAMTVDRFITVVLSNGPKSHVRRQRGAMVACAAAWVISIAASISDAINITVETDLFNQTMCELPSDDTNSKLGYYLQVSLLFFLPFAIIVFCYSAILKTVLQSSNRKRHRTVLVVLSIVAAFFICWGPYNILLFIQAFYQPKPCDEIERLYIAHEICQIFAYSHCCMNPLLYMLSHKLRKHLLHLLSCEKVRRKNKESTVIQNATSVAQNYADILELQCK